MIVGCDIVDAQNPLQTRLLRHLESSVWRDHLLVQTDQLNVVDL